MSILVAVRTSYLTKVCTNDFDLGGRLGVSGRDNYRTGIRETGYGTEDLIQVVLDRHKSARFYDNGTEVLSR
jgi:hypothetical protein